MLLNTPQCRGWHCTKKNDMVLNVNHALDEELCLRENHFYAVTFIRFIFKPPNNMVIFLLLNFSLSSFLSDSLQLHGL